MYNNYTPLQQRQLALQEYSNTQSTYLLVCAPARSTALKSTLTSSTASSDWWTGWTGN